MPFKMLGSTSTYVPPSVVQAAITPVPTTLLKTNSGSAALVPPQEEEEAETVGGSVWDLLMPKPRLAPRPPLGPPPPELLAQTVWEYATI